MKEVMRMMMNSMMKRKKRKKRNLIKDRSEDMLKSQMKKKLD